MEEQMYVNYRNELMFLVPLVPPLNNSTIVEPTTGTASGTPVTILQAQYPI
jgi:hypothetical protein